MLLRIRTVRKTTMILEKRESCPFYIFNCDYLYLSQLRPFDLSFVCYTEVFQDFISRASCFSRSLFFFKKIVLDRIKV